MPGVRCPKCMGQGNEVWVIPGKSCHVCHTPCAWAFLGEPDRSWNKIWLIQWVHFILRSSSGAIAWGFYSCLWSSCHEDWDFTAFKCSDLIEFTRNIPATTQFSSPCCLWLLAMAPFFSCIVSLFEPRPSGLVDELRLDLCPAFDEIFFLIHTCFDSLNRFFFLSQFAPSRTFDCTFAHMYTSSRDVCDVTSSLRLLHRH